jgi:hypothetical protein
LDVPVSAHAEAATETAPPRDAGSDAPASPARADGMTRVLNVTAVPTDASVLEGPLEPEPCDFHRSYRGKIGETPLGVLLDEQGGQVHYDRPGPALPIEKREIDGTAIRFAEKGGGKFDGLCDPKTGGIAGTYVLKGKQQSFELWPRPRAWPAMYRISRERRVAGNFPGCGKVAKPNAITTASIPGDDYGYAICAPTSPKARREAIAEGTAACVASDTSLRVFGIKNAATVNRILDEQSPFKSASSELKKCWNLHSHYSSAWLMYASEDLLTVQTFRSEDWGGAHPMNFTDGGISIDLRRGKLVRLDEIVTNTDALREVTHSCAWDYFAVEGIEKTGEAPAYPPHYPADCNESPLNQLSWDCDPNERQKLGPMWALFGDGIAILAHGHAHAVAALDGRGPILSWAALLRAGILDSSSPVAHLWKGITAAPAAAPACTSAFAGQPGLVRWSVVKPGE